MSDVRVIGGAFPGLGGEVEIRQPGLPVTMWTVTDLEPGRSFTWRAAAPGVRTAAATGTP